MFGEISKEKSRRRWGGQEEIEEITKAPKKRNEL